jgi:uncharacterized membrane-anchored protein
MMRKSTFSSTTLVSFVLALGPLVPASMIASFPTVAFAQAAAPATNEIADRVAREAFENGIRAARATLKPITGRVQLPDAEAFLTVPQGYGFLDKAQSKTMLVDIWGNPPDSAEGVLGIIVKLNTEALGDPWGAVITYDNSGYVTDTDAADIKPEKLLADEQALEADANAERAKAGYDAIHLAGWAEPPFYDSLGKRIYWAKRLQIVGEEGEGLNYNIRVLGRKGYLALNFVATIDDLPAVKAAAPDVLKMAEFDDGAKYSDYKQGDKASGIGLAGLVAGAGAVAVAKKVGLLGLLIAFGKKGFVLVLLAFGWLWNKVKGVFAKKQDDDIVGNFGTDFVAPGPVQETTQSAPDFAQPQTLDAKQTPPIDRG